MENPKQPTGITDIDRFPFYERGSGEEVKGDMLKFTSDDIYLGFDNREDDNYCQGALIYQKR